jgi:integrase
MEPRDVAPPLDFARGGRECVERPEQAIEPRWLDVNAAAQYLCLIRGIDARRDIEWMRGTVDVIGKFRKERAVPMQPDARAALEEQLEEEGKLWKQNPQRLRGRRRLGARAGWRQHLHADEDTA